MSSDKVSQTKETVVDSTEKSKQVGADKATDANKTAEALLHGDNKHDDPSYADQAKEKATEAKEGVAGTGQKVTSSIAEGWQKTKDKVNDINQYPDKK